MKKLLCLLLGGTIALSVLLSGCGCSDSSAQDSDSSQSVEPTDTKVKTTGSKVHINDSSLGDIWISELDGVPLNKLDNNNFTSDDSFKYYSENGQPASKEGIDISYYICEFFRINIFKTICIGSRTQCSDNLLLSVMGSKGDNFHILIKFPYF